MSFASFFEPFRPSRVQLISDAFLVVGMTLCVCITLIVPGVWTTPVVGSVTHIVGLAFSVISSVFPVGCSAKVLSGWVFSDFSSTSFAGGFSVKEGCFFPSESASLLVGDLGGAYCVLRKSTGSGSFLFPPLSGPFFFSNRLFIFSRISASNSGLGPSSMERKSVFRDSAELVSVLNFSEFSFLGSDSLFVSVLLLSELDGVISGVTCLRGIPFFCLTLGGFGFCVRFQLHTS